MEGRQALQMPLSHVDGSVAGQFRGFCNGKRRRRQGEGVVACVRGLLSTALGIVDALAVTGAACQDG